MSGSLSTPLRHPGNLLPVLAALVSVVQARVGLGAVGGRELDVVPVQTGDCGVATLAVEGGGGAHIQLVVLGLHHGNCFA